MNIHIIGIAGIGASALAQYYLKKGHCVSGSDLAFADIIEVLKKQGIKVLIGKPKAKNISKDIDLVIYSPAVKQDNPELKQAKKFRIKCQTYPEALGRLTKEYFTIAVAGTHGKSSTTAMLALLLIKAGLDPTVIVGTKLKEFKGSNFRMGKSKYLLIEACEHTASFLNYWPQITILTNIEADHLDYYKNLNNVLKAFKEFAGHLSKDGLLVVNGDDANVKKIKSKKYKVIDFSIKQKEAKKIKQVLNVCGEHNVYNALACLTVARALKIPDKTSFSALSKYRGCWRRFEIKKTKINNKPLTVVVDYAHHPTEIKAVLQATREKFPNKKIWCVFQPHQYQRTHFLFNDFVRAFKNVLFEKKIDDLIIIDIFGVAGRGDKEIEKKVSSAKLIEKIDNKQAIHISSIKKVENYLKKNLKGNEVVMIVGAGDIYKMSDAF